MKQMKNTLKWTALLLFISVTGCDKKEKQAKTPNPVLFKNQLKALEQAKHIEGVIQNSAEEQRKTIEDNASSQAQ
jgi:hypothetical protein